VKLRKAPLPFAREDDHPIPGHAGRTAGVTTLVGCSITILATFLPWVEKVAFGVSLTTIGFQTAGILLAFLAMISAGIASAVLLRRPAAARVAIVLVLLAVTQLGLAIWDSANIVQAIGQVSSHQVLISAVGTGVYAAVLGPVVTVVGGILAWTTRGRG
jgi:hypothetical protein